MYFRQKHSIKLRVPTLVVGQIKCIVEHFSTEVSWYGDISIAENEDITIDKIYLFPQVVTGGTFRTDTKQVSEIYDAWYDAKLKEMLKIYEETGVEKPIMQYNGHSHVNAGCGVSQEDERFRRSRDGINVYSIHNKQGDVDWEIWMDDVIYEDDDIDVVYVDDEVFKDKDHILKPGYAKTGPGRTEADAIEERLQEAHGQNWQDYNKGYYGIADDYYAGVAYPGATYPYR